MAETTPLTINIPNALVPRVVGALCASAGLPATGPNAKAVVRQWIVQTVLTQNEAEAAAAVRRKEAEAAAQIKAPEGLE